MLTPHRVMAAVQARRPDCHLQWKEGVGYDANAIAYIMLLVARPTVGDCRAVWL